MLGFGALWLLAYFEMNARASGLDLGWIVLLNILAVLCFFWGQLTLLNISTVTTNGAVGSWYFSPTTVERGCVGCRPAVCAALFRACTTSLGSIAFGSLLGALPSPPPGTAAPGKRRPMRIVWRARARERERERERERDAPMVSRGEAGAVLVSI